MVDRMPTLLRYPVARTLKIIGERWTILILRALARMGLASFRTFLALRQELDDSVLFRGLKASRFYENHPPQAEYVLTEKGQALGPALEL